MHNYWLDWLAINENNVVSATTDFRLKKKKIKQKKKQTICVLLELDS